MSAAAEDRDTLGREEQRRAFLEALFGQAEGWLDVRWIHEKHPPKRAPLPDVETALGNVEAGENLARNVYVGVATRGTGDLGEKAGGKGNLRETWAVWVDVDHHAEGDRELLDHDLETFPRPPSMRVWSGGGEHLYWLLAEPLDLTTEAGRDRLENVLRGLTDVLHGDRAATDASRVLRVPGTMNRPDAKKRERGRREAECLLLELDADRRYAFEHFEAFELRGRELAREKHEPHEYQRAAWDGTLPPSVERLIREDAKVRARWEGSTEGLGGYGGNPPGDSEVDYSLALLLAYRLLGAAAGDEGTRDRAGQEIEAALRARREKAGAKAVRSGYYTLTVGKALAWAEAELAKQCEELRGKAEELVTEGVRLPFRLSAEGVEYREERQTEGGETRRRFVRVSSPLEVLAVTRDERGEEWGRLLRVRDADGRAHEWAMPMRMLAGDGADLRAYLLGLGLEIDPGRKAREWLQAYLTSTKPSARVRCVSRVGWHGRAYVLPDAVFGEGGDAEPVRLQVAGAFDHAFRLSGSLEEWQRKVAGLSERSSRLVLALSAGFAAPLLGPLDAESGGFHLRGDSTIGKTTALHVGGSIFGGGGVRGYVRQWRATANGLEGVAVGHCDALLCLDELSQVDAREAGSIAYMLANGQGKSRARRDGTARPAPEWRVLFLSSGELSLSDKVREDGRGRSTAGQAVRVVDVPADAGRGFGLFDELEGFGNAAALATHLRTQACTSYGTAGRDFLARIAGDLEFSLARVRKARAAFVDSHCPAGADGLLMAA